MTKNHGSRSKRNRARRPRSLREETQPIAPTREVEAPRKTVQLAQPTPLPVEAGEDECEVMAKLGRFRAHLRWRRSPDPEAPPPRSPTSRTESPKPRWKRLPVALGVAAAFVLGSAVATLAAWELVPFVETTRVLGEMVHLRVTAPLAVLGSIVLYMIRRRSHR